MKKYYGNYIGIVVQNNDPEHRGRLKIFVPHLSATVYDNWNKEAKTKDRNFSFPDQETNPDLDGIMDTLKNILPWADCAAPLFGGSASGRYNAFKREGSTSDSNTWEGDEKVEGNRPLQNYTEDNSYSDAFTGSSDNETKNRFANPYSHEYTPSNYSNLARGMFTIPNVGAHVWLFFTAGDPRFPIYFAVSHNKEDWNRIYSQSQDDLYVEDGDGNQEISNELFTSVDYPDAYQNLDSSVKGAELDGNTKTFRAKSVLNSNKHSLEFVDTDQHEILKMTHFSGSFKEFTNYANIELATNNDQKMVLNDQFLTVNKNQSIYIAKARELIVAEDSYRTIGDTTTEQVEAVVNIIKEIHESKQLFDVKRTVHDAVGYGTSPLQEKKGDFAFCPTCGGQAYAPAEHSIQNYFSATIDPSWGEPLGCERAAEPEWKIDFLEFESIVQQLNSKLSEITGQVGFYLGNRCDTCGRSIGGGTSGFSPSTENGNWATEKKRQNIGKLISSKTEELYNTERVLGEGDEIIGITKNKIENIGLVMNDMEPFRLDPIGKVRFNGLYTAMEGTYPTYKASQLVEYVDVDDVPGGDYNLTVSNKFKLLVGARGINIKTFGPLDMYAPIINIGAQQLNLTSKGEVNIDGGERVAIKARQIVLQPDSTTQSLIIDGVVQPSGASVAVEGNMHILGNTILNGGVMVEGELGITHVSAPVEWHLTEPAKPIKTTTEIAYCSGGLESHIHYIMPHQHYFQNMPIDFYPSNEFVREAMNDVNKTGIMEAKTLMITTSSDALTGDQLVFNNPWHRGSSNVVVLSGEVVN